MVGGGAQGEKVRIAVFTAKTKIAISGFSVFYVLILFAFSRFLCFYHFGSIE